MRIYICTDYKICILSCNSMGGRTLPFSWHRVLDQKTNDQNSTLHKATMVNRHRPHSSMNGRHSERPLRRAATYLVGRLSGLVWCRRGSRGRLGGRVAVALLSPAHVFALYGVEYWKYPVNQPDECFRGSVEPHMHRK